MEHNCNRDNEITKIKIDLAVAQSDIKFVKDDIKDIKVNIEKGNEKIVTLLYWLMGSMAVSIISIVGYLVNKGVK